MSEPLEGLNLPVEFLVHRAPWARGVQLLLHVPPRYPGGRPTMNLDHDWQLVWG